MMYENRKAVGFLCFDLEKGVHTVLFAYTCPEKRRTGVFSELLQYAAEHASYPLRISVSEEMEGYEFVRSRVQRIGFRLDSVSIFYRCLSSDFGKWETYMEEKGDKLTGMLIRQGFSCDSFQETTEEILSEIYHSEENGFDNYLSVKPFFDYPTRGMDSHLSMAATKDGHLAAYCLVSHQDNDLICFEHMACAKKYRGQGIILLPFAQAMDRIREYGCSGIYYMISESNFSSNAFRRKVIDRVTSSQVRCEAYLHDSNDSCAMKNKSNRRGGKVLSAAVRRAF